VLVLVFVAEEVEPTTGGRADVLLRLVQTVERGDERHEARVAVDAQGTAAALEPLDLAVAGRPLPMTLVEASRTGLAFIVSRRLEAGEAVDLAFDDGSGVTVHCRAAVLRVERAVYGRHRYAARITAMGQLDQVRLDRMVARAASRTARATPPRTSARRRPSVAGRCAGSPPA
jgi:hypothetical protein